MQVARQGALNLTTIDYAEIDADVQRIWIVRRAASTTISEGGPSRSSKSSSRPSRNRRARSPRRPGITDGDQAQVLVAVSVKTSNAGAPEQEPRAWRMRIGVQKVGDGAKYLDVQFVP